MKNRLWAELLGIIPGSTFFAWLAKGAVAVWSQNHIALLVGGIWKPVNEESWLLLLPPKESLSHPSSLLDELICLCSVAPSCFLYFSGLLRVSLPGKARTHAHLRLQESLVNGPFSFLATIMSLRHIRMGLHEC